MPGICFCWLVSCLLIFRHQFTSEPPSLVGGLLETSEPSNPLNYSSNPPCPTNTHGRQAKLAVFPFHDVERGAPVGSRRAPEQPRGDGAVVEFDVVDIVDGQAGAGLTAREAD